MESIPKASQDNSHNYLPFHHDCSILVEQSPQFDLRNINHISRVITWINLGLQPDKELLLNLLQQLLSPSAHMRLSRGLATRCWPSEHRFLHRPSVSFLPLNRHHSPHHRPLPFPRTSTVSSVLPSRSNFSTQASLRISVTTMDESIKQHYLADSPPTVVRLEVKQHFDKLQDPKLRKYAHYISRFVFVLLVLCEYR